MSRRQPGGCSPVETANDCTIAEGYTALWSGATPRAIERFTDALARDPASPHRWCDLGDALALAGDRTRAAACYRRALALGPQVPAVLLHIVNFAAVAGCSEEALSAGRRLLAIAPWEYDDMVLSQLARAGCAADRIERETGGRRHAPPRG